MLVLTRRVDEAISIGDSIVVTILGIEGDRVKIGISAPRDIPILRNEVFQAVQAQSALQNRLADQPEPSSFEQLRRLLEENAPPQVAPPSEQAAGEASAADASAAEQPVEPPASEKSASKKPAQDNPEEQA